MKHHVSDLLSTQLDSRSNLRANIDMTFYDVILGPVYALDWCKGPSPGSRSPRSAFRLGIASHTEDFRNRIAIVGLQDERALVVEDDYEYDEYAGQADFVTLVEAQHGYPATCLQWQPAAAYGAAGGWAQQKGGTSELLATTGDALRVWEYASDGAGPGMGSYVGRQASGSGHRLTLKTALSGVRVCFWSLARLARVYVYAYRLS